jgi:beta-lactamase class A
MPVRFSRSRVARSSGSRSRRWTRSTKGKLSLDDKVTLGRGDLTLFHQPLRDKILGGGHTTTLGSLMFDAITESDNTANDKLMRSIGGPQEVRDMIARKGPRLDPLLQRRARAPIEDRRADLDPELFDRQCIL